jgi:hypothetical protein
MFMPFIFWGAILAGLGFGLLFILRSEKEFDWRDFSGLAITSSAGCAIAGYFLHEYVISLGFGFGISLSIFLGTLLVYISNVVLLGIAWLLSFILRMIFKKDKSQ